MTETLAAMSAFFATPSGKGILIGVAVLVLAAIAVPVWRSMKYLFKAALWILVIVAVVLLGAGAVWVWLDYKATDPDQKAALRQEASDVFRKVIPAANGEAAHDE
jgi:hypothetical protein